MLRLAIPRWLDTNYLTCNRLDTFYVLGGLLCASPQPARPCTKKRTKPISTLLKHCAIADRTSLSMSSKKPTNRMADTGLLRRSLLRSFHPRRARQFSIRPAQFRIDHLLLAAAKWR